MYQRTNIQRGMAVTSYDGIQVGRVIDVTSDGILIEKGLFFLRDFQVPFSDISAVRGDDIILVRNHDDLRRSDTEPQEGNARGTVGVAGVSAPPPQEGLGLGPTDLTQARMDSAKFQDHGQYDLRTFHEGGKTLPPDPLAEARMDSAKFQDHGQYDVGARSEATVAGTEVERSVAARPVAPAREEAPILPPTPHEPALSERRAAGPGWDPLSVDEENEENKAPRTGGPDTEPPTRY